MKRFIVLVMMLFASLAFSQEMPSISSTSITTGSASVGAFLSTDANAVVPTWSKPYVRMGEQTGEILLASTKEFGKVRRRVVQVFIADPDPNVPLGKCILYQTEQKLTELTDEELFFEVPDIQRMLSTHNSLRTTAWTDTMRSRDLGKSVFLEPIRIKDLKMVVVTIASF